ncbi:MAG TPA: DUF4389 domain-containing protein [Methylococcaceae bacterium]|jgi:hypothetical protein|nr:DUF4389 domain-containing protein [Methylococcaceae bacterium]
MKDPIFDNQVPTNAFVRLLFMILFFALFGAVRFMVWALVLFQFLTHLFTGRVNRRALQWGEALSNWIHRMMLFMTYNTERMPFPFSSFGADAD